MVRSINHSACSCWSIYSGLHDTASPVVLGSFVHSFVDNDASVYLTSSADGDTCATAGHGRVCSCW